MVHSHDAPIAHRTVMCPGRMEEVKFEKIRDD